MGPATEHAEPGDQVVLLGASNLNRALPTAIETARSVLGGPCRFLIATGHGRSYGASSSLLCRTLPGIAQCGLWEALERSGSRRSYALLTDIGNDIVYGYPAEQIVDWVRQCVDRLEAARARVVVTDLPMENVRHVGRGRFLLLRTIFFPTCRTSFERVVAAGNAVSEALHGLAAEGRVHLVRQPSAWYGFDAIHIRRRYWEAAFGWMLGAWADNSGAETVRAGVPGMPLGRALRVRLMKPQRWRLCGIERRCAQPTGRLGDGSTLRLY